MFLMAPMPPKVPDNRLPLRLSLYLVINMVGWGL